MQKKCGNEMETERLHALARLEELAEKKTKIHSRLLMDTALAEDMAHLSLRHKQRKETLRALIMGKQEKDK